MPIYIEDYFLDIARDLRSAVTSINIESLVDIMVVIGRYEGFFNMLFAGSIRE